MLKPLKVFIHSITILCLSGCFNYNHHSFNSGSYKLDDYSSHCIINEITYDIEQVYFVITPIDKTTYEESKCLNTIMSYLADESGNLYFSLDFKIRFNDYDTWNVDLYDKKQNLGRSDSYQFLLQIENEDIKCSFLIVLNLFNSDGLFIKNIYSKCNINNVNIDKCDFYLFFRKE